MPVWARLTLRHRWWALLLSLAAVLAFLRVPVVSAQGTALVSAGIAGPLPLDPAASVWGRAQPVRLPLTAQGLWIPMGGGTITDVTIRSVNNGTWIGFLVEWADATKDVSAYRTEDFPDAVAVQIAASTAAPPFACMGQADSQVQIWHWRGSRDVFAGADPSQAAAYPYALADYYPFADDPTFYPGWATGNFLSAYNTTPVETLVAGGPGTLTSASVHTVYGRGHYADGRWHVAFSRPLAAIASDEIALDGTRRFSIAFAAWDGSSGDRDGQKSTSSWVTLSISEAPEAPLPPLEIWAMGALLALVAMTLVALFWRDVRRRREKRPNTEDEPEGHRGEGTR